MQPDLAAGEIKLIRGDWRFRKATLSIFVHNRTDQSPEVRRFVALMAEHAATLKPPV